MKLNLLSRALNLSLNNIWRNKILSAATVFVMAIILFIFNIILAVNFIAKDSIENLNQKIDIVVYLKESTDYVDAKGIISEIEKLEGVTKVVYFSKQEALTQMGKLQPDLAKSFEKYNLGNPLPASINISTESPEYHAGIDKFLNQERFTAYLSNVTSSSDSSNNAIISSVSKNLVALNKFTNQLTFWLVLIFFVGGCLIMINALQLTIFNRQKEIGIMKLVGASYNFIKLPFIIEAIIYGTLSVLISFILLFFVANNINISSTSLLNYYAEGRLAMIFMAELAVTILLSISSSLIALHEYLRK